MVFRVQAVVFLTIVLGTVLGEARWLRGWSTARKLRSLHQDHLLGDELATLLRLGEILADGQVDDYPETMPEKGNDLGADEQVSQAPRRRTRVARRRGHHRKLRHPRARWHPMGHEVEGQEPSYLDLAESMPTTPTRVRGKRHNRLKTWTELDRKSYVDSRPRPSQFDNERMFEVEVREAQNSSLCNYTVVPIPDTTGTRLPRELEHIKCNHVGSKCQDRGTYCCLQTYRNVEVVYGGGSEPRTEILKVYSGCVCSLQIYGTLEPYTPRIEIDD
ncbi:hypothetical protein QAD02_003982 [Eretmocerus hayati]|uniref:Uncharacterized protein n=1 Tax=Eretmocerus hayati TaxID=131215 RepID=A0ACC2NNP6_9HYME|nr:hypothetical protein QAD02_003982 [Eretmocerus hayati]